MELPTERRKKSSAVEEIAFCILKSDIMLVKIFERKKTFAMYANLNRHELLVHKSVTENPDNLLIFP
ncbi:CLUMA_CG021642, isoform A [Clunio marinus]|uniref:CLUMA_CG021642, isoform A n=1 Tax=Clunio marinus TaxID=568069 RepID=A0A1J1J8K2_9DIPT|nr:CLUMA_CG021642, isoform A [Clunio marinus]